MLRQALSCGDHYSIERGGGWFGGGSRGGEKAIYVVFSEFLIFKGRLNFLEEGIACSFIEMKALGESLLLFSGVATFTHLFLPIILATTFS